MGLADYLAKNYLTADPSSSKKPKKRKRKDATTNPTNLIIDEDEETNTWKKPRAQNPSDDEGPTTVSSHTTHDAPRLKKSSWKTVGTTAPTSADQAAADAIIAAAAAENAASMNPTDEAPTVADEGPMMMESGAHAGLQTAAQVDAAMAVKKAQDEAAWKAANAGRSGKEAETIYRDASGRVINVAMKRAEARREAERKEREKAEEEEAAKGDVQRLEREKRREEVKGAKYMTIARYADDEEMNDKMKEAGRWNDPAAGFLVKKKEGRSVTGKPLYKGAAPPNRYGIRPGYRWDGVDRSNGFESKYFAARNKKSANADLEYAWQMDE